MDMSGEHRIPASRETVWKALNDPEVLKACIPGCETLQENEAGDGFDAKVKAKVGPVKATFSGSVKLENVNAPVSYTIAGEGKGGAAGFAKGSADVSLEEDGAETVLKYGVKAQVGGKLAQLGSRLIDSTAKKYANDFFAKFAEIVGGGGNGAAASDAEPQAAAPAPQSVKDAAEASAPAAAAGAPTPEPAAEPPPAPKEARSDPRPNRPADAEIDDGMKEAEPAKNQPAASAAPPSASPSKAAADAVAQIKRNRKGGLSGMTWVMLVIVAVLILLAIFSGIDGGAG
ncbi:carbon monoxide dehydrogenase subunit G [Marivibrio halodurans]|uniref:Carbon monoxide dehydrogenase subunit G n=1 Tax=Marivibrio halodurans TaxID=2039722 RepID=A0A8J7SJ23_9PROT|nr:carbon monoxide dehydrogenase subunit G [Marivibrio halodurans]MBP5855393.1 carbon monoxide dehydrogenase subunit G [Marivibrio halodurans]